MFVPFVALALAAVGSHCSSARIRPPTGGVKSRTASPVEGRNLEALANQGRLCLTAGCEKAAARIIANMDTSVNPCNDFYQFACGGWIRRHNIPEDKSSLTQFSFIQDKLNTKLRRVVEKPVDKVRDPPHVIKLKSLYQSCMNTTHIDSVGPEPLHEILRQLGGWPVIEGARWNESAFDWLQIIIKLRNLGFSHDMIFETSVTPDFRNNTQYLIDLDQTSFGLSERSSLLKGMDDPIVRAYFKLMTDAAALLGVDDRSRAHEELQQSLEFERTLANYSMPQEERRNISSLYNKMTLRDLKMLAPSISWDIYFNKLLVDPVDDDEQINVAVPKFVVNVANLLNATDKRRVANYIIWRVVLQSYAALGKAWRDRLQEFNAALSGKTREPPREEQCMSSLTGSMALALSNLYVKNYFREDSKGAALTMVKYIMNEFLKVLNEVKWMDPRTRDRAREKAEAIVPHIGYPSELLNDSLLVEHYGNATVTADGYFSNLRNLRKWSTDRSFGQLRRPHLRGEWKKHSQIAVANAFYNPLENCIEFPAGILQGAFFAHDRPNYLNFGAIGYVIGHEITHGFDDKGRQFDKDGNNKNWWERGADEEFREHARCIIQQYNNYTLPNSDLKVNGINTQGENIADNGGIKQAFRAYRQWEKDNGPEGALPGLNFTSHQLFWISAANSWCGKHRPEVQRRRIMSGSHSPAAFRIIGPMSNAPEFAEQFSCAVGSPMNPEHKCTVW